MIGVGEWGKNHVRVFKELLGKQLLAVADLNESSLHRIRALYSQPVTGNYHEILSNPEIQAVSICSPSSAHFQLAKEALEAGKDVLVEKPITLKSEHAEELIELSERLNRVLMVGHIFRYHPGLLSLKRIIDEGTLGEVRFMVAARMGLMTPRPDCGVIFDFGVHDFDIFCYLLNQKHPTEVSAVSRCFLREKFEDVADVSLSFDNKVLCTVQLSWLTPRKVRELWVVGSQKSAKLDYLTQEIEVSESAVIPEYTSFGEFTLTTRMGASYKPYVKSEEPLRLELSHFIECVSKRTRPNTDGYVGLRAVEIAELALKSSSQGRVMKFNNEE